MGAPNKPLMVARGRATKFCIPWKAKVNPNEKALVMYDYTTLFYITPLHPVGFEPTAINLEGCCSIHLS